MASTALFLKDNVEDGDFNQYWYSPRTIARIVEDLTVQAGEDKVIAFLSTPSLYFSMPDDIRARSFVLDFDKKWAADRGFVFYDFNAPTELPASLLGKCDILVIDPPFITHEVWRKYVETTRLLSPSAADGTMTGKVLGTTVIENASLLHDLLGASPTAFQPSIPNLVYQYNLFTNYPSAVFDVKNPEIPE